MRRHWPLLLAYALLAAIVRAWFAPGLITGEDFWAPPFLSLTTIAHSGFWPPSWEPLRDFGQNMQPWWPAFPLWAVCGALFRAGVSWPVLERLLWLWPFFVLVIGVPYWFLVRRGLSPAVSTTCAALYAVNTWTIGEIERGHMPALLAYALIPAVVDRFLAILGERRTAPMWQAALLLAVQALYEVRYVYLTMLACAAIYIVLLLRDRRRVARAIVVARVGGGLAMFALLTLYLWLPLLFSPFSAGIDTSMASFENLSGRMSLLHALTLFYPYYHHNLNVDAFFPAPVEWVFVVLPVAAAAGWFAGRRHYATLPLAVLWVATVVVLAGPNPPLGAVSTFVFVHLPGFKAFRDVTKLFSLAMFTSAFGIGLFLNRALAWMRLRGWRVEAAFAVVGVFAIGALMHDAFNPLRASNFSATTMRGQDLALQRFVDEAPGRGRIGFLPSYFPGLDPSTRHPIVSLGEVALAQPPFGLNALVTHTDHDTIPSLIARALESVRVKSVLRNAGLQYVVLVDDPERMLDTSSDYGTDPQQLLRELASLTWLKPVERLGDDRVYEVRDDRDIRAAFYTQGASPAFRSLNPSEIEGVTRPGLLMQVAAYDPGWRLALLPAGARTTGNPLRDFTLFRRYFMPERDHLVLETDFNGWRTTSTARALLIFVPTALSTLCAILELPALLLVALASVLLYSRERVPLRRVRDRMAVTP